MKAKSFGRYISMLTKYAHSFFDYEFKSTNLGRGELSHLMYLYDKDCVTQDYLSKRVNVDKGSTAKSIKKLLDQGYVTRRTSEDDKRSYCIELTDKAIELRHIMRATSDRWNEIIKSGIDENDFEIFVKVAIQMAENAQVYHKETYKKDIQGVCNER